MIWAAVGRDGRRLVVWGLGGTPEAAKEDAKLWLVDTAGDVDQEAMSALSCHGISEAAGVVIVAGDCSWPVKLSVTLGEASEGYFTNDLDDAVATGREMARRGLR